MRKYFVIWITSVCDIAKRRVRLIYHYLVYTLDTAVIRSNTSHLGLFIDRTKKKKNISDEKFIRQDCIMHENTQLE